MPARPTSSRARTRLQKMERAMARRTTELREANQELLLKNQKLLELDRLKSEFLSLVSHELQTPLTSIKGYTETMLYPEEIVISQEKQLHYLRIINKQVDRLSHMIDNLLLVARAESRGLQLNMERVDLEEVVERVLQELQPKLGTRPVRINFPTRPLWISADGEKLHEIFLNLLDNAQKYSGVSTPIVIAIAQRSQELRIAIRDRGIGISPEDMDQLFQKFHRLDNPSNRQIQGTGLGLYITKVLVEAHGGVTRVKSRPGKGTTVTFTLPVGEGPK